MDDIILEEVVDFERRQAVLIFAESLIKEIHSSRKSNLEAIHFRKLKHDINIFEDSFCCTCNGKILALDGIEIFIEELLSSYR